MAAHTYRTWLWNQVGFATWNAQWYGGHHMAGYSLLYPPLAARARARGWSASSPRSSPSACSPCSPAGSRRRPARRALAAWLFLGGVMSNVVIGRMPFTLGIALAVGAWACARRSRAAAALLSLASVWASPVAGVFLCVAAVAMLAGARLRGDGGRTGAPRSRSAAPAVVGGLHDGAAVPGGRLRPLRRRARSGRCCSSASARSRSSTRARRTALWAAALYVAILVAAFAIPNSLGQNALRPGVVLGPALLVLFARPRAPRAAIVVIAVALVYLQWLPAVRAVEEARGDPSTRGGVPRRGAATSWSRARSPASASRCRSRRTTGRRPTSRRTIRSRAAGTASSTARSTRSSTTARHPLTADALRALAARERRALGRAAGRAARLLRRAPSGSCCSTGCPYLEPVHESPRLAHLGGARRRAAGLGRRAADRGRRRRVRPRGDAAGDGDRAPARDAVLDGRDRRRLRVGGRATRAGRGSTCGAPGCCACGRASRPAARSGASRAARTDGRRSPAARVRSAPL